MHSPVLPGILSPGPLDIGPIAVPPVVMSMPAFLFGWPANRAVVAASRAWSMPPEAARAATAS